MSLPIRIKLTALHSTVVILSFVSFFWVSDLGFQHSIEATVDEASHANLEVVHRLLQNKAGLGSRKVRDELQ